MGCYHSKPTDSIITYKVEKLFVVHKNGAIHRFYSSGEQCILSERKSRKSFHHTGEFMVGIVNKLHIEHIPTPKLSEWVIRDPAIEGGYIHKIISIENDYDVVYIRIQKL
jgi:hypothetical protein